MRRVSQGTEGCIGIAILILCATFPGAPVDSGAQPISVVPRAPAGPTPTGSLPETTVPIAGFLLHAVAVLTDARASDDLDWLAVSESGGLSGTPLSGDPSTNWVPVLLDSGAATDLLGYEDSLVLGLDAAYLTDNPFPAAGVCGEVELLTSEPLGLFVAGPQEVDGAGVLDTAALVGHSNFSLGANTADNAGAGLEIPSVVGAGLFAQHVVSVRNDLPALLAAGTNSFCGPAVGFFASAADPGAPSYPHKFFLEILPAGDGTVSYFGFPDLETGAFHPLIPSTLGGSGALYFTANDVTVTHNGFSESDQFVVDTGAQATIISSIIAAGLDLDPSAPEFTVEVQGFGCVVEAPGFVIDALRIPAIGGALEWTEIPVLVLDIDSPEGGVVPGILGTNLFHDRNLLYVGTVNPPYVLVSDPLDRAWFRSVSRGPGGVILEWGALPALAERDVVLQTADDPGSPEWTNAATNTAGACLGTFEVDPGVSPRAFYRLSVP